jgi:TonB family protein
VRTGSPQPPVAADDPWFGRATPAEPSGREYRAGDPGVVEPVALARLPRKPDPSTPRDRLQVLEVHVNTDGTVESARFIMRPPTYRNRWWVSAAKSWRFRPALKDGKPVRFVMTIPFDEAGGL